MAVGGARAEGRSFESFKKSFFDSEAVLKALDKAERKQLSKFGAFVRQRWRTSLRYRDTPSPAGGPPSVHRSTLRTKTNRKTGARARQAVSPEREFVFFAYEAEEKTVIVGPAKTNQKPPRGIGGQTVTEVIEYGGTETITERQVPNVPRLFPETHGQWVREHDFPTTGHGPLSVARQPKRQRTVRHAPRPAGQLAFDAELPGFLAGFKDSM
jgi:hypothetical protein